MNTHRNFLNLSVALVLAIGIDSNIAFAMGNLQNDQNVDQNSQNQCSSKKQEVSATAKSPHSDLSYQCTLLFPPDKIKNQGITSEKILKKKVTELLITIL